MLTVTIPTPDPTRLAPDDDRAEAAWLTQLGPTSWLVCRVGHRLVADVDAGRAVVIDLDQLARFVGVKPSVLRRSLTRLHQYRIVFFDAGRDHVVGDFTVPLASPAPLPTTHLLPEGIAA